MEVWEWGMARGRSENAGAAQWSSNGGKLVAEEF
jgi:hypothetical protein